LVPQIAHLPTSFPLLRAVSANPKEQNELLAAKLASTAFTDTLPALSEVVSHGYREAKLLELLMERQVPLPRAAWFVRVQQLNTASFRANTGGAMGAQWTETVCAALQAWVDNTGTIEAGVARLIAEDADDAVDDDDADAADASGANVTRGGAQSDAAGGAPGEPSEAAMATLSAQAVTRVPRHKRATYLVRLTQWMLLEGLLDEGKLLARLNEMLRVSARASPRRAALLAYVVPPLLACVERLPSAQPTIVQRLADLLVAASSLQNAVVTRGVRIALRTAMLVQAATCGSAAVLSDAQRALLTNSSTTNSPTTTRVGAQRRLVADGTSVVLAFADSGVRRQRAVESVQLPAPALLAHTLERVVTALDAFGGVWRVVLLLQPLLIAGGAMERGVRDVARRVLEWAVTPRRVGADRAAIAASVLAAIAGGGPSRSANVPMWMRNETQSFVVQCCAADAAANADIESAARLVSELVRRALFVVDAYMRMLIARGLVDRLDTAASSLALTPTLASTPMSAPPPPPPPPPPTSIDGDEWSPASALGDLERDVRRARALTAQSPAASSMRHDAVVIARHAFIVRNAALPVGADDARVSNDLRQRAQALPTSTASVATLNECVASVAAMIESPASCAPDSNALWEALPTTHDRAQLAQAAAQRAASRWHALEPRAAQWVLAWVERVGVTWIVVRSVELARATDVNFGTQVDVLLHWLTASRTAHAAPSESLLADALRTHAPLVICADRVADMLDMLESHVRLTPVAAAFRRRFTHTMRAPSAGGGGGTSMTTAATTTTMTGMQGALSQLHQRALTGAGTSTADAAIVDTSAATACALTAAAHVAALGALARAALLPAPSVVLHMLAAAADALAHTPLDDAATTATLRAAVRRAVSEGVLARALAMLTADDGALLDTTNAPLASLFAVPGVLGDGVPAVPTSVVTAPGDAIAWRRALLHVALRAGTASVWSAPTLGAWLRAWMHATVRIASDAIALPALRDALGAGSAVPVPTSASTQSLVMRYVSRAVLATQVLGTRAHLVGSNAGAAADSESMTSRWIGARRVLLVAGGVAMLHTALGELLAMLADRDALSLHASLPCK
jgi:hypothetical protein